MNDEREGFDLPYSEPLRAALMSGDDKAITDALNDAIRETIERDPTVLAMLESRAIEQRDASAKEPEAAQ